MKRWNIKSERKLIRIIVHILTFLFLCVAWSIRITGKSGGGFQENLLITLLFFPITLPVLILPIIWILKKKIPTEITLNSDTINFNYRNNQNNKTLNLKSISFETRFVDKKIMILSIYKKVISTRGHKIHKHLLSISTPKFLPAWNPKTLIIIAKYLKQIGVEEHDSKKKIHYLDHLF